jgi:hypothetical protein
MKSLPGYPIRLRLQAFRQFTKKIRRDSESTGYEAFDMMEVLMAKLSRRLHNHRVTIVDAMGSGLSFKGESIHTGREVDFSDCGYGCEETDAIREISETMMDIFGQHWEFGCASTYFKGERR